MVGRRLVKIIECCLSVYVYVYTNMSATLDSTALFLFPINRGYRKRGSHSFGAKNNDPSEVLVFTGLFERLFWLGWDVRDKAQQ
jgi:hypothetical protein